MHTLRQHITTLVNQHSTASHTDITKPFNKIIIQRFITANILVLLMQYSSLMFSTLTSITSPLWLASGTACALIFLRGPSILPGLWLGTFIAYSFTPLGTAHAAGWATLLTFQSYILFYLSYRFVSPSLLFYQRRLFIKFISLSLFITAIISYFLLCLFCSAFHSHIAFTTLWLQWWLANFTGLIIFACAIVTWDAYFPQLTHLKEYLFQATYLLVPMILLYMMLLFHDNNATLSIFLMISLFTLLMAISMLLKWCGAITALFIQGMILTFILFLNFPIFHSHISHTLFLQLFTCIEIIFSLFLGSNKVVS